MAVNETESRIPGGFDNARKLGEADLKQNCALISYLQSPLQFSIENGKDSVKHFMNTYVVFVDESRAGVRNPVKYSWSVKFKGQNNADEPMELEKILETEVGILHLNMEDIDIYEDLEEASLSDLFVTVNIDGLEAPLVLKQRIDNLNADIENLIAGGGEDGEMMAVAGDPEITRWLANDFRTFLIELDKNKCKPDDSDIIDISIYLVAAVLYGALQGKKRLLSRNSHFLFGTGENKWLDYINAGAGDDIDNLINTKMGITNIKPHILNFFITGPGDDIVNNEKEDIDDYEERILKGKHFQTDTTYNDKIDLFNKLRFPKSCLELTWEFLKKLKYRNDTWASTRIDKSSHIHNRDCITTIVSEFETAPQSNLKEPTDHAENAYNIMYSKWIQTLLQTSHVQFETIKVKVLDIRSGKPIKNAQVRRLTITRTGINLDTNESVTNFIDTNFENINNEIDSAANKHNWKKLPQGSIGLRSQWALWYLGYDPNGPSANYGDTGRAQYKAYWDAIVLDGSIEAIPLGKQPPEYMLAEIIEEYNNHRATDENGVLNIRIPTNFLEGGKVHVDIGFMDFPVICEAIDDDGRDDPISRPTNAEEATNYKIKFLGNDASNSQNLNWDDNVKGKGHFGWQVSDEDKRCMLQFAQRLYIKTDYGSFNGFDSDLLSSFFGQDSNPIHFVLFGMQWCQPVWDDIEDAKSRQIGSFSLKSYIQDENYAGLHLHLVTLKRDLKGSEQYGGKGYGKYEAPGAPTKWRDPGGHQGYDIYAKVGDKVFALHGGEIYKVDSKPRYKARDKIPDGKKVGDIKIEWEDHISISVEWTRGEINEHKIYELFHLQTRAKELHEYVCAGQVVAAAGRTGNLGAISELPTHVHINVGKSGHKYNPLLTQTLQNFYPENKVCLPNNSEFPLVLPCWCEVTENNENPRTCFFSNTYFIKECWAAAELKCPHISEKERDNVFRLQAQLRYLNEKPTESGHPFKKDNNNNYLHPGPIDGDDGGLVEGGEVNLVVGDSIKPHRLSADDNSWKDNTAQKYRRVIKNDKVGWVLYSDLEGTYNSQSDSYILNKSITNFLHGGLKKREFSKTRKAIYNFRDYAKKPSGSNFLKTGGENNWENYQIAANENDVWKKLKKLALITLPENS